MSQTKFWTSLLIGKCECFLPDLDNAEQVKILNTCIHEEKCLFKPLKQLLADKFTKPKKSHFILALIKCEGFKITDIESIVQSVYGDDALAVRRYIKNLGIVLRKQNLRIAEINGQYKLFNLH